MAFPLAPFPFGAAAFEELPFHVLCFDFSSLCLDIDVTGNGFAISVGGRLKLREKGQSPRRLTRCVLYVPRLIPLLPGMFVRHDGRLAPLTILVWSEASLSQGFPDVALWKSMSRKIPHVFDKEDALI